jgi:hypothetical protein
MSLWEAAAGELQQFNALYTQVERKPQDKAALKKCVNGANKLVKLFTWAKQALTEGVNAEFLSAWRVIGRLAKTKDTTEAELQSGLQQFKTTVQRALDSTAPEQFSYQGFKVFNEEHFADEMCRKSLEGFDLLRALFKKRGVESVIDQGVKRIVLVFDAEGSASFNSGTREMLLSVGELSKSKPGRFIDTFAGETVLHEFGHYVHRNFITGEALEVWDAPYGKPVLRMASRVLERFLERSRVV